jgi:hypothetical protein
MSKGYQAFRFLSHFICRYRDAPKSRVIIGHTTSTSGWLSEYDFVQRHTLWRAQYRVFIAQVRPSNIHTLHPRLPWVASGKLVRDKTKSQGGVGEAAVDGNFGEPVVDLESWSSASSMPSSSTLSLHLPVIGSDASSDKTTISRTAFRFSGPYCHISYISRQPSHSVHLVSVCGVTFPTSRFPKWPR